MSHLAVFDRPLCLLRVQDTAYAERRGGAGIVSSAVSQALEVKLVLQVSPVYAEMEPSEHAVGNVT